MQITLTETLSEIRSEELTGLYGNRLDYLAAFSKSYLTVFARDGQRLIGAARVLSEGVETALLVDLKTADGYDAYYESQERYPVLYMFDGHNLFFDSDATFGKCLGLKDFLDHWGKKMIVVGLACAADDLQRVHEYCPYHIQSRIYGDLWGRGDETVNWIVHDLKPWIDGNYRTWPFREATAIAGYSMGGMMSLFTVLRYDEICRMSQLVSDLQRLHEAEREDLNPVLTDVDLLSLAKSAAADFEGELSTKELQCSVTGDSCVVPGDEGRLRQVAANLLSNAVKYTGMGGHTRITVKNMPKCGILTVEDDGIGIPESDLPLIFERFYRTDRSRSRKTGGVGIGLTIVKAIVTAHGRLVSAETLPEGGSRFTVSLPKSQ